MLFFVSKCLWAAYWKHWWDLEGETWERREQAWRPAAPWGEGFSTWLRAWCVLDDSTRVKCYFLWVHEQKASSKLMVWIQGLLRWEPCLVWLLADGRAALLSRGGFGGSKAAEMPSSLQWLQQRFRASILKHIIYLHVLIFTKLLLKK